MRQRLAAWYWRARLRGAVRLCQWTGKPQRFAYGEWTVEIRLGDSTARVEGHATQLPGYVFGDVDRP